MVVTVIFEFVCLFVGITDSLGALTLVAERVSPTQKGKPGKTQK